MRLMSLTGVPTGDDRSVLRGISFLVICLAVFSIMDAISKFAALASYFVVAVGSAYRYHKLGLVMYDVVKVLVPAAIAGLVLGAIVGHHLPADVMMFVLGMFLLFITIAMVRRIASGDFGQGAAGDGTSLARRSSRPSAWKVAAAGFPGGFVCALLGISGGVVSNPLQQVLAEVPIKNAIANTLAKATITVPIACVMILLLGHNAGHFDLWHPIGVTLCLIPGSLVGSQLGPALTTRLSQVTIHSVFGAITLALGIYALFFGG